MNERFLQFLWKFSLLKPELKTTKGLNIIVLETGKHNKDAGPDFFNSKLRIENTTWAGNVEIHLKSSDWYLHRHHEDKRYDNVILHVVLEHDKTTFNSRGDEISVLEIKNNIHGSIEEIYFNLMMNRFWIPCQQIIQDVDPVVVLSWTEKLMISRLERKARDLDTIFMNNGNNWEQCCFILTARHFGFGMNQQPFEMLARALPFNRIKKHCNELIVTESILFGQAGFLDNNFQDEYPNQLKTNYSYLRKKFGLIPFEQHMWKFLRLRPANFPSIRIAQLAALIHHNDSLFCQITDFKDLNELERIFRIKASSYWDNHYCFDKVSERKYVKSFGKRAIQNMIINVVAPLIFMFSEKKGKEKIKERIIGVLQQMPPESNQIVRKWKEAGIAINNVFDSQGLLELKQHYCDKKKCLECRIGYYLLKE